jgi:hypothetical protein
MVCVWAPSDRSATAALEGGRVILGRPGFTLYAEEIALLDPGLIGGAKNVSLSPDGGLKHTSAAAGERVLLKTMMGRFAAYARDMVEAVAPHYRGHLIRGRTSFRPAEIEGRQTSPLNDDTRLHVDAFSTTPTRGARILRVFANVNEAAPRHWTIGEPFERVAARFLPGVALRPAALNALLAAAGITKGRRAPYDDVMLGLHNAAKTDLAYQAQCQKHPIAFEPGAVWICFTDVVMHAALKGQHALEQTFLLPVDAMAEPAHSPLRILEEMTGRTLA